MCRFDDNLLNRIWEKAQRVEGYDPARFRKDACGAWIIREHYGDKESPFGWEVDHIYPDSKLASKNVPMRLIDDPNNLRPLNRKNNESKGSDYPSYRAVITSEDNRNKEGVFEYTVNEEVRNQVEHLYREYL